MSGEGQPPRASTRALRLTLVASLRGIRSTSSTGLGRLVAGQAGLGEGDDLGLGGRGGRVAGLDDGVHPPAPLGVGQPDHDDVGDAGVVDQRVLDLGREDVGPAGDDEVRAAVGDVEEAVVVERAEVAGAGEPVVGDGQADRAAEVVVEPAGRPAQEDLADLAGRQVVAVVVEDADLGVAVAAPDAAGVRRATRRRAWRPGRGPRSCRRRGRGGRLPMSSIHRRTSDGGDGGGALQHPDQRAEVAVVDRRARRRCVAASSAWR